MKAGVLAPAKGHPPRSFLCLAFFCLVAQALAQPASRGEAAHLRYLSSGRFDEVMRFLASERDGQTLRDFVARLKGQPGTNLDLPAVLKIMAGRNEDEWVFDAFFSEGPTGAWAKRERFAYIGGLCDLGRPRVLADALFEVFHEGPALSNFAPGAETLRGLTVIASAKEGEALDGRLGALPANPKPFFVEVLAARLILARGSKDGARLGQRAAALAQVGGVPDGAGRNGGLVSAVLMDPDGVALDLFALGRDREGLIWVEAFGALGFSPTVQGAADRARNRLGLPVPSRLRTLFLDGSFAQIISELPETDEPYCRMAYLASGKVPGRRSLSPVARHREDFAKALFAHDEDGARALLWSNQFSLQDETLMALRGALAPGENPKDWGFATAFLKLYWTLDVRAEALWAGEAAAVSPAVADWAALGLLALACDRDDRGLVNRVATLTEGRLKGSGAREAFLFRLGRFWAPREPARGQALLRRLLREFPDTVYRYGAQALL